MNLITIILKSSPHVLQFHFDKYADAEICMREIVLKANKLDIDGVILRDDYGSMAAIVKDEIAGIFITDLIREMSAHEAVEVEKHRKDIRVGKKMQAEQNSGLAIPRGLMREA